MSDRTNSQTSATLLGRLRIDPYDEVAWNEFVVRYGPTVHAWCIRWRLSTEDAKDVTQQVFTKLLMVMRKFEYDRSKGLFRSWLKTVAASCMADFRTLESNHVDLVVQESQNVIDQAEARTDFVKRLTDEFDLERTEIIFAQVQRERPREWEAYRLSVLERKSGQEAAEILGVTVGRVYSNVSIVRARMRDLAGKFED